MITAFVEGLIFLGDGKVLSPGTVWVEGEKIVEVTEGTSRLPSDARKISLKGKMLLPGFIDCHVHFCSDAGPDPTTSLLKESRYLTTLKAAEFSKRTLMAGVTTARDLGGPHGVVLSVRDAIHSGFIPGPRILTANQMLCMTGGHAWQMGCEVDGPEEVRKAARKQIKAGADVLKLMATGGVGTPGVDPGSPQLTEEELRAGIDEAHKAGRKTATHAQGTQGILNALRAGIDGIEHGIFLNDEAISLMVKGNIPLVPTLSAPYNTSRKGVEAGIPSWKVEKNARVMNTHKESILKARKAGIRIAMGTDAGTSFNVHGANLTELKLMVELGFLPMEALLAGTRIAAQVLGLESEIGTIEKGKRADLVVVEGNPLEDIEILTKEGSLRLVMKAGRIVREE